MCHQTVGLVAAELERHGIATTSVSVLREITEKVRTPRALFVDFPLGYPLGRPGDSGLQTRVVRAALSLLHHAGPGPILETFNE
jgi:D-proline reductase (dithiol) PrdB